MYDTVLRWKDISSVVGRSERTIRRWIRGKKFPRQLRIKRGTYQAGWFLGTVRDWLFESGWTPTVSEKKTLVRYRKDQIRADAAQREQAIIDRKRPDDMPPCFDCHATMLCHCEATEDTCRDMTDWIRDGRNQHADD